MYCIWAASLEQIVDVSFRQNCAKGPQSRGSPRFCIVSRGSGTDTKLYPAKHYTFDALGVDNIKRRICPVLHFWCIRCRTRHQLHFWYIKHRICDVLHFWQFQVSTCCFHLWVHQASSWSIGWVLFMATRTCTQIYMHANLLSKHSTNTCIGHQNHDPVPKRWLGEACPDHACTTLTQISWPFPHYCACCFAVMRHDL